VHALDLFINTGDGNPASTRYAIQVAPPVSGDTWVQADGTVGPNPVFRMAAAWDARRVTGLAKATTYTFTATARNGEDIDTVPGPGMSLATADNLPAGAPTVSFPTVQSNIANLVCEIVIPSVDPDGDPVVYEYDWYVKHSGDSDFSLFSDGIPEASLLSQIDNMNTTPGDIWYCMVTPHDMDMAGTPVTTPECTIVLGGVTPSFMSFGVSPLEVTLGQSLTVLGQIFPTPSGSGTVTFESTSPSGVVSNTFPEGTVFSSGVYMKSFYPTEATEARPAWSVTASWPGDLTYQAATSSPVTFTVLRAQPDLQLSLSHTSALLNLSGAETFTVTADLSVAGFPSELLPLLAGCTIRLSVQTPDGQTPWAPLEALTDANGMAHFDKTVFDGAGIVFDQSGVWRFRSQFDGDVNLRSASTADFATTAARLTIKEGAGYAIIVLGRLDAAAEGHGEHAQTSDYIYSVLKGRGFADEDIYYLREHLAGEEDRGHPVSGAATAANLQYAIETWAQNKMLASPAPLYLILVDHGNPGIFYLDVGATGPVEFVTAGNIGGWLDVLQSALGVVKESAAEQPITIVYGACYSGSFIPALSGTNRIIIASSSGNEIAYRGVKNTETLLRDGDFFLTEFFRNAGEGRTVKDAFELACHKSYEYTASRTGSGANIPQHPRLDDNSDGSGTTGLLSSVAGLDGALVAGMDLGLGSNAGNSVGWFTAIPPVFLSPGEPLAEDIWAEATGRELIPADESWIEVKTPVYDDGAVATAGYETFQRVASMAGPIVSGTAPESLGDGRTRHRWSYADLTGHPDLAGGFTTPGTYKVYYFLRDGITGQVGAYLVTNIYVSQTGNLPPAAVTQLYPADDGIVNVSLFLAWTESVDPDGDPVTYRVEVSEDPAFPVATTLVKDGLTDTVLTLDVGDGIENDHDYYWRVIPTDPYGASPSPNDVRRFLVRGSPGVPGAITGSVTDMDSGVGINGCTLTLSPTALEGASMASGGYFLGSVSQGVYNLTLSAPGYSDLQVNGVIVTSGRYTVLNLQLEPDGNRPPTLTLIGNKQVTHGHTLSFQVTATDPDAAQTLTYGEAGLPLGASFDTVTGQCIWQPTQSAVAGSPYTVTFSVTDNGDPILSDEETIQIIVNLGAYISGLSLVTVGEWVELEFHGEDIPDAWETHWRHEGHDIIGEMDALLILGEATLDHTGLYEATQVFSKDDPITATFYLTVSEGVPLHKSALLLLITLLVSLALVYAGKKWKQEGMDN
ncbi:MAG: carboxypeptidase regulatory-like domain-containing protein, partial [Candidatus Hydrogenedentes bacterium]|nr:carboxypeptidase regulatory-like domain-containing protein [Candidatus Hydrogenedentota bacterium]